MSCIICCFYSQTPRVRSSYALRKQQQLSVEGIREGLTKWSCDGKRCGECLSVLCISQNMLDFAVDTISRLRTATFSRAEHTISAHVEEQLSTLLRLSRSTLQYVICGVQTCKQGWNWSHGFSTSTSNRMHATFNQWWQSANPQASKLSKTCSMKNVSGSQNTCECGV